MNPSRRDSEWGIAIWYCLGCKGWGSKVADEPNPPIAGESNGCHPSHKIIKVYEERKK